MIFRLISRKVCLNDSSPQTVAIVALGLGVLTDVLTALSISWYLRKLKTGYKNCDTLVNKLISYAVSCLAATPLEVAEMRPDTFRSTRGW